MRFERKITSAIVSCLLLIQCGVSLRVYRPFPEEILFERVRPIPNVTVTVPAGYETKLGIYDGYFFNPDDLVNEYGHLSYLIRKDLSIRGERFPRLIREGGKIQVTDFLLESKDDCSSNLVQVRLRASVQIGKEKPEVFDYKDRIESHVTNCFHVFSTVTLVPLLWYVPYMGYRGNREDQINQLGRNVMEEFFLFLENQSGFNSSPKLLKRQHNQEPVNDPKLKEILDSL
ncbi:hypothetical protein [Leptospira idonii]|uniref:Uncharacterized protein n=1 Tax=Leptospira idonii TaxID=1193500 RepID=A0A4R9M4E4_9LEPT|nr:hypothetical protein [Leptospira idonii]TGN19628.1 hypothetical protein EHS15_07540 [Leptospira idonii]